MDVNYENNGFLSGAAKRKALKTHLAKKRLNTRRKGNKVSISQQGEANKIKNNFKSTTKTHQN